MCSQASPLPPPACTQPQSSTAPAESLMACDRLWGSREDAGSQLKPIPEVDAALPPQPVRAHHLPASFAPQFVLYHTTGLWEALCGVGGCCPSRGHGRAEATLAVSVPFIASP